ncbi:hypothetical protein OCK74_03640 [Chitinophagaceae bacterium LB-8]|uniref:Uncharacterized protein n=1 Tax=Paraflavisolibacter caeni TaxID=2982496 RepID=A0A9X2XN45_9BACT|nr:hypothetical protein [Paraflavisolibacter caeni]MCU7548188.1 hypothetical protein [Paraflavisolibacter caeni]
MKRIVISTLFFSLAICCFCQQTKVPKTLTSQDYLKKSKRQKTAAWLLTGAGTIGLITTMTIDAGQAVEGGLTTLFSLGYVEPEYHSYTVPYLLSAACVVGGITYFISASKNKRRARSVSTDLKMGNIPVLHPFSIAKRYYPSVSLQVAL